MSTRRSQRSVSRGGVSGRGLLLAGSAAAVLSVPALAGPQGERVAAGSARFHRDGAHTTIVTSQTAIINYQSFNLRANESVRFVQPDASSRVLNRIRGADPTVINGSVAANGSVYFVNPAGVVFGPNAVLNVGDLFAAAGHITDRDFLAGRDRFTGLTGEVINRGTINALGGAHLLGERVANFGHIIAPDGVITLASGNDVLIGKRGGHVFAKVTSDHAPVSRGAGVTNAGTLDAGSGTIQLGAGDHFALALKKPSELIGGLVMIEGGDVDVAGSIDVSGDATGLGDGGRVTVTGRTVALRGADIDASGVAGGDGGWVRVGGDVQGRGAMKRSGATLVGSGSRIDVSAIGSGDAGSAVVWADGGTLFRGSIDASAIDGRGGFVEVSGKGWLGYAGDVEVASATGRGGTLLLDPKNILIVGAGDTILGEVTLSEQIDSFLDFGIDAGNADAGFADDVTSVLTDATLSSLLVGLNASSGTLILRAENDIVFGGTTAIDINNSAGSSSLDLRALRSIRVEDTMGEPTPASVSIDLGTGRFIARANYRPSGLEIARVSNRDAGDADIRFNDVSSIAAGDVVLQVGSGWNGRQFGGVIVAPEITATGSVLLQNLATRTSGASGGSVLNASAADTISAGRVVIEQLADLGGVVGTPVSALTLDTGTLNVAARGAGQPEPAERGDDRQHERGGRRGGARGRDRDGSLDRWVCDDGHDRF
jgi:filamentous hemagglutinin family protein